MKLLRYGPPGREKPGLLDAEGRVRDLSAAVGDFDAAGFTARSLAKLAKLRPDALPLVRGRPRLGPPVAGTRHFIAVGLNYADHAAETGAKPPAEPILFSKAPSCIVGANDEVVIPAGSTKTDWEVELAIVIGTGGHAIPEARALEHVAGYCVCNDVSERAWQLEGTGTWSKGKGAPTFGPLGPWLVTRDEVPDAGALDMWLDVNGEPMQRGSTRTMIFGVAHLVAYCSRHMMLEAGDVITTGTPPGVGMGKKPPRYLKPGDVMRLGIQGLGEQRQVVGRAGG